MDRTLTTLLLSGIALFAQILAQGLAQPLQAQPLRVFIEPVAAIRVDPRHVGPDFQPVMTSLEAPVPGSGSYRAMLQERKAEREASFVPDNRNRFERRADIPAPALGTNFQGNPYNFSIPNDNHVAVSNDGWVISVINSTVYAYDTLGNQVMGMGLGAFADTLGISAGKFDPKVFYDPQENRFVLVFLAGFGPSDTHIIVCFSTSSDPLQPWNFYRLPGNPFANTTWTDYPMVALTDEEVFITINLLREGEPWQTGFSQTLVWQMDKMDGFAGDSLRGGFWQGIEFGGKPLRNLRPIQGGSTLYGPDLWLLSNRNFALSNDSIFLVHISDRFDEPDAELTVQVLRSDEPYGLPPVARQPSNQTFDTNDGRILGAFYEGDRIQFVSATIDPATGRTGIFHGMIHDVPGSPLLEANILGDRSSDSLDLGYPNIAFTGTDPSEIQSIIVFDYSSKTRFPSFGAVYSNYFAYSDITTIKEGETFVNIASGIYERWGDYTGVQRVYNQPGTVWASGNIGKVRPSLPPFGLDCNCNATWVGQVRATEVVSVGLAEPGLAVLQELKTWPNPSASELSVVFTLAERSQLLVQVLDGQGRLVEVIWSGPGQVGENLFRMSTAPLAPGMYTLAILQQPLGVGNGGIGNSATQAGAVRAASGAAAAGGTSTSQKQNYPAGVSSVFSSTFVVAR